VASDQKILSAMEDLTDELRANRKETHKLNENLEVFREQLEPLVEALGGAGGGAGLAQQLVSGLFGGAKRKS
jgi:hypothetical protein